MSTPCINRYLHQSVPGFSLPQPFYTSPDILQREFTDILANRWMLVGHVSRIPAVGDYFVFEMGSDSIIICRESDSTVRALANVCRHRGSRLCWQQSGSVKRFTCPYHAWSYGLDGRLLAARQMGADFDRTAYSLTEISSEIVQGLIFINFSSNPVNFSAVRSLIEDCLSCYDVVGAVTAAQEVYSFNANWKLAVENYLECYHCSPAHPEYARYHSTKVPRSDVTSQCEAMWRNAERVNGLTVPPTQRYGLEAGPEEEFYFYDRYPLYAPAVTGSRNGKPLAPLMGRHNDYDGGAAYIHVGPLSYILAYPDHVVLYRFTPISAQLTHAEVIWLVAGRAEESMDYDKDELTWLWRVTSEEDKQIVEHNQMGVNSRFYQPGPYSQMEINVVRFLDWYVAQFR